MTRFPFLLEVAAASLLATLLAFGLRPALTVSWGGWAAVVVPLACGITWLVFATSAALRATSAGAR